MSFSTNPDISPTAQAAITHLLGSDQSESIAVGEALWDIASNGDDAQTDAALITSAQELIASAQTFINAVSPTTTIQTLPLSKADITSLFHFIDAVESNVACDIFSDAKDANIPFQIAVLKANATNLVDFKKRMIASNALAQAVEAENGDQDDCEQMLTIHYAHYDCHVDPKVTWDDTYECACDSDCPACGTKNIQAVSWHTSDEACTDECDPHHNRSVTLV